MTYRDPDICILQTDAEAPPGSGWTEEEYQQCGCWRCLLDLERIKQIDQIVKERLK